MRLFPALLVECLRQAVNRHVTRGKNMRADARFPVYIENALVPKYKYPRPILYMEETVVDIVELTSKDVPVALTAIDRYKDPRKPIFVDYRYRDGKFYRKARYHPELFKAQTLMNPYSRLDRRDPISRLVWRTAHMARHHAKRALPDGIVQDLLARDRVSAHEETFQEMLPKLTMPTEHAQIVEAARERFLEACAEFIIVNGEIWVECPEPMLGIETTLRPGKITCTTPRMPIPDFHHGDVFPAALERVLFAVGQFEEVVARAKDLYNPDMPWKAKDFSIVVAMPEVFSPEAPVLDILYQLKACSRIKSSPEEITSRLEAFTKAPEEWTEENIYGEVERLLDTLPEISHWFVENLAYEKRRYDEREIVPPVTISSIGP